MTSIVLVSLTVFLFFGSLCSLMSKFVDRCFRIVEVTFAVDIIDQQVYYIHYVYFLVFAFKRYSLTAFFIECFDRFRSVDDSLTFTVDLFTMMFFSASPTVLPLLNVTNKNFIQKPNKTLSVFAIKQFFAVFVFQITSFRMIGVVLSHLNINSF